ncbi:hypothetical protein BC826DRAFT_1121221 [Russula brevipes]|nr:hypothetical protein BC826DRAFT_1121221 [Russula brevipes]
MVLCRTLIDANIPRHNKIREAIIAQWRVSFEQLKSDLSKSCGRISFTADIWSNSNLEAYLALTTHWISHDGSSGHLSLNAALIGFSRLKKRHTGNNIGRNILFLLDWADVTLKASNMIPSSVLAESFVFYAPWTSAGKAFAIDWYFDTELDEFSHWKLTELDWYILEGRAAHRDPHPHHLDGTVDGTDNTRPTPSHSFSSRPSPTVVSAVSLLATLRLLPSPHLPPLRLALPRRLSSSPPISAAPGLSPPSSWPSPPTQEPRRPEPSLSTPPCSPSSTPQSATLGSQLAICHCSAPHSPTHRHLPEANHPCPDSPRAALESHPCDEMHRTLPHRLPPTQRCQAVAAKPAVAVVKAVSGRMVNACSLAEGAHDLSVQHITHDCKLCHDLQCWVSAVWCPSHWALRTQAGGVGRSPMHGPGMHIALGCVCQHTVLWSGRAVCFLSWGDFGGFPVSAGAQARLCGVGDMIGARRHHQQAEQEEKEKKAHERKAKQDQEQRAKARSVLAARRSAKTKEQRKLGERNGRRGLLQRQLTQSPPSPPSPTLTALQFPTSPTPLPPTLAHRKTPTSLSLAAPQTHTCFAFWQHSGRALIVLPTAKLYKSSALVLVWSGSFSPTLARQYRSSRPLPSMALTQ